MKNFNFWESLIAVVLTILAGLILGISPALVVALAITYFLSCCLAVDIFHHIREKKLPELFEGIGDIFAFAAIVLNLAGLRANNLIMTYAAFGCLLCDLILILIQTKKASKKDK